MILFLEQISALHVVDQPIDDRVQKLNCQKSNKCNWYFGARTKHVGRFLQKLEDVTRVPNKVPVYFLHAEFDLRNPVNGDAPDRDCVHTVGGPKPLPPQVIGSDKMK